jgi:3-dehydroquinate synthase
VGATGRVVVRSIEIKAEVVSKDERESGLRKVLNFGHTLGHAVESAAGYTLPHGSCVALGMILEARLGEALGITRTGTAATLERLVELLDLPTRLPAALDPEAVLTFTRSDKKGRGGRPQYVLLSQPGQVAQGIDWAQEVPDQAVLSVLKEGRA